MGLCEHTSWIIIRGDQKRVKVLKDLQALGTRGIWGLGNLDVPMTRPMDAGIWARDEIENGQLARALS